MKTNVVKLNRVNLNIIGLNGYIHKRNIDSDGYIKFKDPVVAQICATTWGDGIGLTKEQAATITSLGSVFRSNTEIEYFEELQYFTKMIGIEDHSFRDTTNLKKVVLPDSVYRLDADVFHGSGIESINLNNIQSISTSAFSQCTNLSIEINMPNLRYWGTSDTDRSQFGSSGITKIINLGMVTTIPNYFASASTSLEQVILPEGTISIGQEAFKGCSALRDVYLPKSITTLNGSCFYGAAVQNDIDLPNLTYMKGSEFSSCDMKRIISLGSITDTGNSTFSSTLVEEVNLPTTLVRIGNSAFHGCKELRQIEIPVNVTEIGQSAFQNCSVLETVILRPTTPPTLGNYNHYGNQARWYVPDESLSDYQAATNWNVFASRIKGISELPTT